MNKRIEREVIELFCSLVGEEVERLQETAKRMDLSVAEVRAIISKHNQERG